MSSVDDISQAVNSRRGEPVWEIARLFPAQGDWTEEAYFAIESTRLVELVDGCLEFLPRPTKFHQRIVQFLCSLIAQFVRGGVGGEVFFAPLPVQLWPGRIREPDIVYLNASHNVDDEDYPQTADLVVEVVSKGADARQRDLEQKQADYARARIPEYWIVDPENQHVTVLVLREDTYKTHGVFGSDDVATSVLLNGFTLPVKQIWAAGAGKTAS